MHNCFKCSGLESEYGSLRMMATAVVKSWEVQRCWGASAEAVVPVPLQPVPVPPYRKAPVANRYRYHSNRYRYQHGIVAGIEQDYDSNARVHSSFDHQLEITMEKGIKDKGKVEKATFDF